MSGWVKLHRSCLNHWIVTEPDKFGAWCQMLLLASHRDTKLLFDGELVSCPRGSFVTSKRSLAERWKWSREKTDTFFKTLELEEMIHTKPGHRHTHVFITNYDSYQGCEESDQATDPPLTRPAPGHRPTPIKNVKELKEDLSAPKVEFPPELQDEVSRAAIDEWLGYKRERREGYKPRGLKAFLTGLVKEGLTGRKLKDAVEYTTFKGWSGIVPKPEPTLTHGPMPKNVATAEIAAFSEALRISVDVVSSNPQVRARAEGADWRIREAIRRTGGSQRYRQSTERDHPKLSADFAKAYRELEHTPAPRESIKAVPDITGVVATLINKGGP